MGAECGWDMYLEDYLMVRRCVLYFNVYNILRYISIVTRSQERSPSPQPKSCFQHCHSVAFTAYVLTVHSDFEVKIPWYVYELNTV